MQTVNRQILSLDSLEELLLRTGLRLGDEVIVRIKPQGLEITTNPAGDPCAQAKTLHNSNWKLMRRWETCLMPSYLDEFIERDLSAAVTNR